MPNVIKENENIINLLVKLREKYANAGQDLEHYLKGLLETNFEPYWDYINLESLLALQQPKTDHPDELIFISYHQYTEIFFKLILHEFKQISTAEKLTSAFFIEKIKRINRYFVKLTDSFDIMIDGMDREQFLKFRMALLPASGFQSAQYRLIEMAMTDLENLVHVTKREGVSSMSLEDKLNDIYWRTGAIDVKSGEKTLTLKQFETYYNQSFVWFAKEKESTNAYAKYKQFIEDSGPDAELKSQMRLLDYNVNVDWPLSHFKSAVKYLKTQNDPIEATGGTNWTSYLPPRFQKIIAFPELWSSDEKEEWGKQWVMEQIKS
jgi:tryptophan 2,3-dioxygenase